ncbi:MAG: hypothetical protein C4334_01410 [Pyrinomonas sp.]
MIEDLSEGLSPSLRFTRPVCPRVIFIENSLTVPETCFFNGIFNGSVPYDQGIHREFVLQQSIDSIRSGPSLRTFPAVRRFNEAAFPASICAPRAVESLSGTRFALPSWGRKKKMRKLMVSSLLFLFLATSVVSVTSAQDRKRSRFGRKARSAAIVGGATAVGAAAGGASGAAITGGAAAIYAANRPAARRHFKKRNRRIATVAGGTVAGAGIGAAVGGKKAAAIGAGVGAAGSYLYTRKSSSYKRDERRYRRRGRVVRRQP